MEIPFFTRSEFFIKSNQSEIDLNFAGAIRLPGRRFRLWALVLIGIILAEIVAYLIIQGHWFIAASAIVALPLVVLFSSQPFSGVILWLLVMPFSSALPNSALIYWSVYRLLPPLLFCMVIFSRIVKAREYPPVRFGPAELSMAILILLGPCLILYYQPDPDLALIRFADRMILPFIMYSVIRLSAPREKELSQLKWLALFIAFSQSTIGFLSWFAPQVLPQVWHYLNGLRTTGSLRDPDLYALILVFSAALMMHTAANHKSGFTRLILFLATGLCAIFAFLSLERAAWLGGVFLVMGLVIMYPRIMVRMLIIGSIVIVILGTGILSTHLTLSIDRFRESSPVLDRIVIFDAMTRMVELKPIFGWGYETLDKNIQPFYHRVGEASVNRIVTSHNTYLTILTELGVVGFMLYLFPVIWWLILSARVWTRLPREGLWSQNLLGSLWLVMLFNFIICNSIDMRWFEIGITLWWLVLGLIANMVYPYLAGRDHRTVVPVLIQNSYE